MAENIKRRVAAARLAVAFVAAGTIAGAAWAQAGTQPPVASTSASDYLLKTDSIKSQNIINGSLLFKDFKKGQLPSLVQFNKLGKDFQQFKKTTNAGLSSVKAELATHKTQIDGIKGELGSFVKLSDADARYVKVTDDIVRGDGSVFTASKLVNPNNQTSMLSVPGMFSVDVLGSTVIVTNTSGDELGHSACGDQNDSGTLAPNASFQCTVGESTESIQFFSWGREVAATLSFSSISSQQGLQSTVQILIGL